MYSPERDSRGAVPLKSLHLTPSTTTRSDASAIWRLALDGRTPSLPCAGSPRAAFERAARRAAAAYGVDYLAAISPSCML